MPMATCSSGIATEVAAARIRGVRESDLPSITRIYAHEVLHGAASYETVPPDLDTMRQRLTAVLSAGYPYLAADASGEFAGFAYASSYRAREGYRWTVEDSVYVDPDFHRRGIGRALLAELIARCTALGYRQMVAVIGDGANQASIALHERAGFAMAARFPAMGWKFGRWLDNVQMQRALGDGHLTAPGASALPRGAIAGNPGAGC